MIFEYKKVKGISGLASFREKLANHATKSSQHLRRDIANCFGEYEILFHGYGVYVHQNQLKQHLDLHKTGSLQMKNLIICATFCNGKTLYCPLSLNLQQHRNNF